MSRDKIIPYQDLEDELKKTPPIINQYIEALIAENLKVQQQSVKFKAESVSYKNRATAAEDELHKIQGAPIKLEDLLDDV